MVTVGGGDGDEGKPWVAVGDSGGGMCVLDARMGLVLYRWKVNSESGVSHAETVPGMPHMLLTAAERTLTGNFFNHLPLQSSPPVLKMALTTTTRHDTARHANSLGSVGQRARGVAFVPAARCGGHHRAGTPSALLWPVNGGPPSSRHASAAL